MKVTIELTKEEFIRMLPPRLRDLYESLVNNMVKLGADREESEYLVAELILDYLRTKEKEEN